MGDDRGCVCALVCIIISHFVGELGTKSFCGTNCESSQTEMESMIRSSGFPLNFPICIPNLAVIIRQYQYKVMICFCPGFHYTYNTKFSLIRQLNFLYWIFPAASASTGSGAYPSSYPMDPGGYYLGSKAAGA
jgi:hypothetical protein